MSSNLTDRINGVLSSLAVKAPCLHATTANIALSGLGTRAGGPWASALTAGDRVLVTSQTDATENGIYDADSSEWRRSKDFDGNRDVVQGTRVPVVTDNAYAGVFYEVTTESPITIGTSEINFTVSTGDASALSVTPTGSITSISLADLFARAVDAKHYGMSPAKTAAQNATAMALAVATGRPVYVQDGEYQINPFAIVQGAQIIGESKDATILVPNGSTTIIDWNYDTNGNVVLRNFLLHNIKFDQRSFGAAPIIKLIGAQYGTFNNVLFHDTSGSSTSLCVHLEFSYFMDLQKIHLREIYNGIRLYGVDYSRGPNHNMLREINGENSRGYSIRLDYARGNNIEFVDLEYSGNNIPYGVILSESSYNEIRDFWYEANSATVANPAILIEATTTSTNKKNSIRRSAQIIHPTNAVQCINSLDTLIEDVRFVGGTTNIQDDSNTNLMVVHPQYESPSVGLISAGASSVNTVVKYRTDEGMVQYTPSVTYSGGNGTLSYTNRQGWYSRDGRLVHVQGYVEFAKGTASGNLKIDLPFATVGITLMYVGVTMTGNGFTGLSGQMQGLITPGQSSFEVFYGVGALTNVTATETDASAWLAYSFSYITG